MAELTHCAKLHKLQFSAIINSNIKASYISISYVNGSTIRTMTKKEKKKRKHIFKLWIQRQFLKIQ